MKYLLWLAIMFAFCPTIVSQEVVEHRATVAESATPSSFEQKLDRQVRFDTAGRTLVASIVELAFAYQLPTGIEYADREATTRPLNLYFQNESVRRILEAITEQVPGYSVSFSGGIVDVFAAKGREDPSNVLNTVIKDFAVSQLDTDRTDMELFCALSHAVTPSGGCGGSHPVGQWGPLKVTLHLQNARVYEVLNAIVAENGKAIWTVIVMVPDLCLFADTNRHYVHRRLRNSGRSLAVSLSQCRQIAPCTCKFSEAGKSNPQNVTRSSGTH